MSNILKINSLLRDSPIIIRDSDGFIDIVPIEDIFKSEKHKYEGILEEYKNSNIWNGTDWSTIIDGHCSQDSSSRCIAIQTRRAVIETVYISENPQIGEELYNINYPLHNNILHSNLDLAKFIGFVVAEGYIATDGGITLAAKDEDVLHFYSQLLCNQYGWRYRIEHFLSGYNKDSIISRSILSNNSYFGKWLKKEIYTLRSNEKRVPKFILNSTIDVKKSFFSGYYAGDGRKAGHERYEYKGFTTKSSTLCLGIIYLFNSFSLQNAKCKIDYRGGDKKYYYIQFDCGYNTNKGIRRRKNKNEIIKILDINNNSNWLYHIQTNNNLLATGPNLVRTSH